MIPSEIILKTEQYCESVAFNFTAFWIGIAAIALIIAAISIPVGLHDFTGGWRIGFPVIVSLMTILLGGSVVAVVCSSELGGHPTYKEQYYVRVSDYKSLDDEITDNYYIVEQDDNMYIIREK